MADPTPFTPGYSFTDWQTSNPTKPLPGNKVDQDMANIETSIDEIVDAIKDVRRSDGKLANEIVTLDSLDATVAAGVGAGALASAEAAAASADAAGDSAVAAAASATAASGSATAASGYASTALTYRNAADGFADDAAAAATLSQTARDFANLWATAGSGVTVDDGVNTPGNSAYHWAQVALGAATGALPDDSVSTTKIVDGAVTSAKIADGTIATGDIADGAITSAKIADGTIATGDVADGAITSAKIADATVANTDLANMAQATVKGRASGAGTGAPADLVAADLFAILGGLVPAKPQTASGVGQVQTLNSTAGGGLTLPAGGKWFAAWAGFNSGALSSGFQVAVATGGTTVQAGSGSVINTGFCWRIE